MKILVVGSGGREHALCWAIAASPLCDTLYCAPGNGGISREAVCVPIDPLDIDALVNFAKSTGIDFVVVGPEAPLAAGLVDRLEASGIAAFGPSAKAAQLEASKGFARDLCQRYGIPGPDYARFTEPAAALNYIRNRGAPIVVKADGLAAGKGVTVAASLAEAEAAVVALAEGQFGQAGSEIVIEELLRGEEASFFALVNGDTVLPLVGAQDHKAVGEGDIGPNTGGMGSYSPAPVLTEHLEQRIIEEIIVPVARAMVEEGHSYKGVLYAGVMIGDEGPKVLEFNVRFGDPECQVLLPRLMSDLLPALIATRDGELAHFDLRWLPSAALCVVMAAKGYPGDYEKGSEIKGLQKLDDMDDVIAFHAGTRLEEGKVITAGGRVLGVTALGGDVAEAQARAYQAIDMLDWPSGFCRRDIGWRAISSS
ncbi:MAG: Phosphoribosylamine--glycine ligase [Alphaproteobacteria bacterium MarineAlpha9_Bin5]|nr:MAG: Phosphoribosylamine--glycine ligase [Alphaproteobacteria bacterium MarineAlpha9_Bin6]PPR40173.1 MAG: Phosphoribosylamine--glycine ligase [Alphaproteobacteria bacterium MarineAlpha9_Bin5]HHZ68243.1 phosphoribosylamine--glycine ligase [Alphaproteobacteria bacterium]HIA22261.1 phosphoribosylamine--glycine ligase [Alphaproteobacteria bacterium]HIM72782.1 phosphoribosylamine--glycine ligase [Alphaproteobacteria bacterium]